jgi:hypothetical protein
MSRKHLAVALVLGLSLLVSALPSGADGPFQYYPLTPCRVVDTRNTSPSQGGYGPGLKNGESKQFPVQGNCLVPVGAKAVTMNVTVTKPATTILYGGYLTLWPTGGTKPLVSTLNWPTGTGALANGAIVPLADQTLEPNDLSVFAYVASKTAKVEVILDVTGYFQ